MTTAFENYLRTGRRRASSPMLETKYNPWHDREDGRFTFAGQGTYAAGRRSIQSRNAEAGPRGGGGSFGGGGASGSWLTPRPRSDDGGGGATGSRGSHPAPQPASRQPTRVSALAPKKAVAEPQLTIRKYGYDFAIDAHARTRGISGEIRLQSRPRSRRAQSDAGKPDRRRSDDGGHYIAARFNGPREWFNHFAQNANFNRGAYRALEDQWAKAVRSGNRVFVDIVPHYRGSSMRPHRLIVTSIVDGKKRVADFPNEKQGR